MKQFFAVVAVSFYSGCNSKMTFVILCLYIIEMRDGRRTLVYDVVGLKKPPPRISALCKSFIATPTSLSSKFGIRTRFPPGHWRPSNKELSSGLRSCVILSHLLFWNSVISDTIWSLRSVHEYLRKSSLVRSCRRLSALRRRILSTIQPGSLFLSARVRSVVALRDLALSITNCCNGHLDVFAIVPISAFIIGFYYRQREDSTGVELDNGPTLQFNSPRTSTLPSCWKTISRLTFVSIRLKFL